MVPVLWLSYRFYFEIHDKQALGLFKPAATAGVENISIKGRYEFRLKVYADLSNAGTVEPEKIPPE